MFALIYQINFWQRKNMSDKNSSVNNNLSVETKQKEVLFQNPNNLQNGLFGNEQKAAGNNLGLENKSEVSKKSGKMKYILFAIAVALFTIAGLTLLNIPLQFVVIKEIFSVFIVSFSSLLGFLLYSFYKNVDKKESELLIQNGTNQLEIIGENKSKDMTRNQITVEKPKNVIEQINDVQIISNRVETDKSKKTAENQIIMIQDRAETPELKIQNEINRIEIISENKPKDIIQNQIIVEKKLEPEIGQVNSIKILGNKMNKKEIGEQKVIMQNDDNASNYDIENEKLNKLLEKLKGNGLKVIYDSENGNWDLERPENVFEQIDEIELTALEKPENIEESIDEIEIQAKEREENVVKQIDEIELTALEKPENVEEQIDEIQITAKERPESIVEQIDEIEINALEKPENVEEQIDPIEIIHVPKLEKEKNKKDQDLNESK